jgi:hypothetical protein
MVRLIRDGTGTSIHGLFVPAETLSGMGIYER